MYMFIASAAPVVIFACSSSSGTGGSTTTTTTTTSTTGACTPADKVADGTSNFPYEMVSCVRNNLTSGVSAIASCLQADAGLTPACSDCFATFGACSAMHCISACFSDAGPTADECTLCVQCNCGVALAKCSGFSDSLPPDGGCPAM
jgi:hypothetical protein